MSCATCGAKVICDNCLADVTERARAEERKKAAEKVRRFANVYYVLDLEPTANTQLNKLADEIERGEG
jgi:hypothetical protein